jgi:hypothetical protein
MAYRERWNNNTPRNIHWYKAELQKLRDQDADEVNWNANTLKWFMSYAEHLLNTRIGNSRIQIQGLDYKGVYNKLFQKFFGFELVYLTHHDTSRSYLVPKELAKAYRNTRGELIYVTHARWQWLRDLDEIKWCSRAKDWFTNGAFCQFWTMGEGGQAVQVIAAGYKLFACPICSKHYENLPSLRTRNRAHSSECCVWCKDAVPSNRPHTPATVHGSYHSHKSYWKFFPVRHPRDNSVPIGVELEMQYKLDRNTYDPVRASWQLYQQQLEINKDWNYFYMENDSSIGDYGLEMITMPMSRRLHNIYWKAMLPKIREQFLGWNTEERAGDAQYGIHTTFEVAQFGQFNLARLIKFVENSGNKEFIQAMAQRGKIYGYQGSIAGQTKKVKEVVLISRDGKMQGSHQRTQAIHVKSGGQLCEVRMFRTTLNRISFMKNLQFLYAFHEWANTTPFQTSHKAFIDWLLKNEQLYAKYACLYKYMAYERFPVKQPVWDVSNPWKDDFSALVLRNQKGQTDMFQTAYVPNLVDYQT